MTYRTLRTKYPNFRHSKALPVLAPIALALALTLPAHAAGPLPSGGNFVAGKGSIGGSGTALTINQTSGRGVIDWTSFSIGSGNTVTFNNGHGATLNRVTGAHPSSIYGALKGTGSVYLINPQGIVVGSTGVVSTGGRFVASTLNTDNAIFMSGGSLTLSGTSNAAVVNLGKIGSSSGDVFLIARTAVGNLGSISAPKGTAELAVGQQVLLQDSSSSRQVFVQTGSGGMVLSSGAIHAAQISLQAADGNVFALAGNHEALRATGTATRDGHVWLVADKGNVVLSGQIAASNANGHGGTVDTNVGKRLLLGLGTRVSAGTWNITAPVFTIDSFAANALANSLDSGTSINLQTTGANASGDINVAANIGWIGGASLTLGAYHTIAIGSGVIIANAGKGNLTLHSDATAIDNGSSVINGGRIDWSRSTGTVNAFYDMNGHYVAGTLVRNSAWTPPAYSGLVTQLTAYKLVNSLADLQKLSSSNMNGNYALGADINAIDTTGTAVFIPIGTSANPFTGQFDGMGHTIQFLSYQNLTHVTGPIGLFGTIGKSGVVRNVGLTDSNTDPSPPPYGNFSCPAGGCVVGIIAGDNKGVIANVYTSGGMTDDTPYINAMFGGIAGRNEGLIERSWSNASSGDSIVNGGLAAINTGTITQSYSSGGMWANGTHTIAGGLVGINRGTITQSYTSGGYVVGGEGDTAGNNVIGGLVGVNSGTISQSYAADLIVPHNATAGAVVGKNTGHISSDVYWSVDSTGLTNGGPGVPAANGLSSAQMADPASFRGWNFGPGGAWVLTPYSLSPTLAWQPPGT